MEVTGTEDTHTFHCNSTYVMVLMPCLCLDTWVYSSLSIAQLRESEGLLSG